MFPVVHRRHDVMHIKLSRNIHTYIALERFCTYRSDDGHLPTEVVLATPRDLASCAAMQRSCPCWRAVANHSVDEGG